MRRTKGARAKRRTVIKVWSQFSRSIGGRDRRWLYAIPDLKPRHTSPGVALDRVACKFVGQRVHLLLRAAVGGVDLQKALPGLEREFVIAVFAQDRRHAG